MFMSAKFKKIYSNYNIVNIHRICLDCKRFRSSSAKSKTYSHTILLPKTDFPTRRKGADKDEIQKKGNFSQLYSWQRDNVMGPEFTLHDGPPYANGDLHMGHAVNKIIKDICNRSQLIKGKKVHYVPGWDCHGLPIELKALQKNSNKSETTDSVKTREIARKFALETVGKQKQAFQEWGVMAEWDDQVYLTMNKSYVKNQLMQFHKMYTKGLIYRALKPVFWSPSSKTALAEAELEYNPQHKSTEVYVRFKFQNISPDIKNIANGNVVYALIWTTTPWTLVSNQAICYNPSIYYSLVRISGGEELYVVGSNLIGELEKILKVDFVKIAEFRGEKLKDCTYESYLTGNICPLLDADHVTEAKGTGLVHTAPAHGPDDFLVALRNNITVVCNVDEAGRYINLDEELNGLYVLKEGQDLVIRRLGDALLHQDVFEHSYPMDWRTKKPVILRSSQQWFIDTASLKKRALEELRNVSIYPEASADQYRQGLRSQLEKRPYWCISRQRAWGVPIPVVYDGDKAIVDVRIIEKLSNLMDEKGPDVWWTCDVNELLTEDLITEYELLNKTLTKGKDILDIWFDSGLSWSSVLDGRTADVYIEGVDQFTGWFQSSLLTSVALLNRAPYKSIIVHGFAVDEKKRKMSKSIGNVVDPMDIVYGKDKSQPAYGVDTLRWWVASHGTQHSQIIISKPLLQDCQNEVIRIRNIFKYLLGVTSDLDFDNFDPEMGLNCFDQYIVNECYKFDRGLSILFDGFKYNHVIQNVNNFVSNVVSGLYSHCVKDRMYCSSKNSTDRISSQFVMHTIFYFLSKNLAPILPHLVEEAWSYHVLGNKPFFCTKNVPVLKEVCADLSVVDLVLDIKKELRGRIGNENLKKCVLSIKIGSDYNKLVGINGRNGVLCEILEVSSVVLEKDDIDSFAIDVSESDSNQCLRCRKYNVDTNSDKCLRCEEVLSN